VSPARALSIVASVSLFVACDGSPISTGDDSSTGSDAESSSTSPSGGSGGGGATTDGAPSTAGSSGGPAPTGADDSAGDDGSTSTAGTSDISPRTLAIGDSVFEWNIEDGASIPDFAAQAADLEMTNASVGGAMVLGEPDESIPGQYYPDDWGRVLIDGGANDVGDGCGCGDCIGVVDALISADLSGGAMVELVQQIRDDGAEVVLMGYYTIPPGSEFEECDEELAAMNARYEAFAARTPGVLFVSAADVMRWSDNPEYYAEDLVHPAPAGSEAVGLYIGQQIVAQ
jgi:hypothetical protein